MSTINESFQNAVAEILRKKNGEKTQTGIKDHPV